MISYYEAILFLDDSKNVGIALAIARLYEEV